MCGRRATLIFNGSNAAYVCAYAQQRRVSTMRGPEVSNPESLGPVSMRLSTGQGALTSEHAKRRMYTAAAPAAPTTSCMVYGAGSPATSISALAQVLLLRNYTDVHSAAGNTRAATLSCCEASYNAVERILQQGQEVAGEAASTQSHQWDPAVTAAPAPAPLPLHQHQHQRMCHTAPPAPARQHPLKTATNS